MWRSSKDKPGKQLLPPSSQLLAHAKANRTVDRSYFSELTKKWKAVVRKPIVEDEPEVPAQDDPNLPAYLRHRPVAANPKLFYKTNVVTRGKR